MDRNAVLRKLAALTNQSLAKAEPLDVYGARHADIRTHARFSRGKGIVVPVAKHARRVAALRHAANALARKKPG